MMRIEDGQAGALTEIEITEEMIYAANLELSGFNSDFVTHREAAKNIIVAALEAGGFVTEMRAA